MNEQNQFILEQLKSVLEQCKDDPVKTKAVYDLINSINNHSILKDDDLSIPVDIKITLKKFDGEKKEGDEPVETIIFENGEKKCL